MKKPLKIALLVVLALLLALAAAVFYFVSRIRANAVPIVAAPAATASAEPSATPEIGEGTVVSMEAVPADSSENPIYQAEQKEGKILNILLLGCDSRRLSEKSAGNSDTIMMASINKETKTVTLVSFARDSYMRIQGDQSRYWNKLNAAYAHGGFGRMINTLNADYNYGLDIQYYLGVGFRNFEKLIDAVGGIEVELSAEECYYINWRYAGLLKADNKDKRLQLLASQDLPALPEQDGTYLLNGGQALWYARDRSTGDAAGDSGNDFLRTSRQQYVLELVYNKVRSDMSLGNLVTLAQFTMENATTNMTLDKMIEIGAFLFANDVKIRKISVPADGMWSYGEEIIPPATQASSVIHFSIDKARAYLEDQLYGSGAEAAEATDEPAVTPAG